eukprot:scaffold338_cov361-Pavlova_lutheri.AAC.20
MTRRGMPQSSLAPVCVDRFSSTIRRPYALPRPEPVEEQYPLNPAPTRKHSNSKVNLRVQNTQCARALRRERHLKASKTFPDARSRYVWKLSTR